MKHLLLYFFFILAGLPVASQHFTLSRSLTGHSAPVTALTFRNEDNLLFSGDSTGVIKAWDTQTGKCLYTLRHHEAYISHLACPQKGNTLASAAYDGDIIMWGLDEKKPQKILHNPTSGSYKFKKGYEASFVLFHPEKNNMIYFGGYNGMLIQANLHTMEQQILYKDSLGAITAAGFANNGKAIAFLSTKYLALLDIEKGNIVAQMSKSGRFDDFGCELAQAPLSDEIAVFTYGGEVDFWNIKTQNFVQSVRATHQKGSSMLCLLNGGNTIVTGNNGNGISVISRKTGETKHTLRGHNNVVCTFAAPADEHLLASGGNDNKINLWQKKMKTTGTLFLDRHNQVQKTLSFSKKTINITFWDNCIVDNDIVSIYVNDYVVAEKVSLQKKKATLSCVLKEGVNTCTVYAHSEGDYPPTTLSLIVGDGINRHSMVLKSDMKTNATVKIHVQP